MKKVLIVKMSSLGDVIHLLPAVTDAQKAIPEIEFHWVVENGFREIPGWHSAVTKVIPIAWRKWRKDLLNILKNKDAKNFWHELRAEKYDLVIDAQGLLKSALVSVLAHSKERCGYDFHSARESLAALFYSKNFAVATQDHAIFRLRQLFSAALNYSLPNGNPDYAINQHFTHKTSDQKYLVFLHGTTRSDKYWPQERWIKLAKLVGEQGFKVFLPWGNEQEKQRANNIQDEASKVCEVLPKSTLSELAEISVNAHAVVAVDTGLGHLSAALDVPTISLYGNTDPKLIGATGKHSLHLSAKHSCAEFVDIDVNAVYQALNKIPL